MLAMRQGFTIQRVNVDERDRSAADGTGSPAEETGRREALPLRINAGISQMELVYSENQKRQEAVESTDLELAVAARGATWSRSRPG